jgi:hypothetical protein
MSAQSRTHGARGMHLINFVRLLNVRYIVHTMLFMTRSFYNALNSISSRSKNSGANFFKLISLRVVVFHRS